MKRISFLGIVFFVLIVIGCNKNNEKNVNSIDQDGSKAISLSQLDIDLNEFENLVDSYVQVMNKVKRGETAALLDATKLLKDIDPVTQRIALQVNEMTEEQKNRFMEIASEMQSVR
jgi:hypothetical protein